MVVHDCRTDQFASHPVSTALQGSVSSPSQVKQPPEWQEHGLCCAVAGAGRVRQRSGRTEPFPCSGKMMLGLCGNSDIENSTARPPYRTTRLLHVSPTRRARDMAKLTESAAGMLMRGRTRTDGVIGLVNSPAMATHRRIFSTSASRERLISHRSDSRLATCFVTPRFLRRSRSIYRSIVVTPSRTDDPQPDVDCRICLGSKQEEGQLSTTNTGPRHG